jgi:hypothetical protein
MKRGDKKCFGNWVLLRRGDAECFSNPKFMTSHSAAFRFAKTLENPQTFYMTYS